MFSKITSKSSYIDTDTATAYLSFTDSLHELIRRNLSKGYDGIVFLCIGTDRSTGDSLGPLVGYKMGDMQYKNIYVYGTLERPVHAKNIDETMQKIYEICKRPLIVAVDACLGQVEHVGCISIGEGSIKPGSGVKKELSPVGDIFITGIVNFGGFMDFLILQNTRLSIVMKMADIISNGIKSVLWRINNDPDGACLLYGQNA